MTTATFHCPPGLAPPSAPPPAIDLGALKARQQATWASGDFAVVGTTLQIVGENLAEAADIRAGESVLDVAAGNGNATLAAARRFADVTSTDYVPQLLEKGEARARAEGLSVSFRVADAEALPFADGAFDAVLSTFGVMFAAEQRRAAAELLRVVRPGGRIGLANWTSEGTLGDVFRAIGAHLPPPAGTPSPLAWGSEAWLVEAFGPEASDIRCRRRHFNMRYRSAEHWIEVFRTFYGPTLKAFAALDEAGGRRLAAALATLLARRNVAGPSSLVVPCEYLEVVIVRKG
jgi:SAM-dependent methyltransferase